jgi:hypothetical protein
MDKTKERRREERLRYRWPVWFAEDFTINVCEGLMIDVSSGGLAFTCKADDNCPYAGQRLVTRFSIPNMAAQDGAAMRSFTRSGDVVRVEALNNDLRRVAIQFHEPLSLKPCEQASVELMQNKNQS